MKRLLTVTVVCGALSLLGATCRADDRRDTRENPQQPPSRPEWTVIPQRQPEPVPQDQRTPVTQRQPMRVPQEQPVPLPPRQPLSPAEDRGRLRYHETGPGTGLWVYEADDAVAGPDAVPGPRSLTPVTVDEPGGAVIPPPPAAPRGEGAAPWLEPIPEAGFDRHDPARVGDPALTFKPGEFATAAVKLYPWVKEDRARNIAPGAVQAVVAVRHPLICPFPCRCHRDQVAFARVWVPPWRARRILVEKHGTELDLDYGSHRVTIESGKGRIEVKYHD